MAVIHPTTAPASPTEHDGTDFFFPINDDPDTFRQPDFDVYEWVMDENDTSDWIRTTGCNSLIAVCEAACQWQIPGGGSQKIFTGTGLATNPTSTVVGLICGTVMPPVIRLKSNADSNSVTLYVMRPNRT